MLGFAILAINNNTVCIVLSGHNIKGINDELSVNSKNKNTIPAIFSSILQMTLPYGAQFLLIISYANGKLNFFDLIGNAWYYLFLFLP